MWHCVSMPAKHVFYSGRVQGVGFRYATKQLAAGFDVTGWVKNLPDGRVELVAAADDAAELDAFLAELEDHSALAHHIREKESTAIPRPDGLTGFAIIR